MESKNKITVQVNGRNRGEIDTDVFTPREIAVAQAAAAVAKWVVDRTIRRIVYGPGIVNFVVV